MASAIPATPSTIVLEPEQNSSFFLNVAYAAFHSSFSLSLDSTGRPSAQRLLHSAPHSSSPSVPASSAQGGFAIALGGGLRDRAGVGRKAALPDQGARCRRCPIAGGVGRDLHRLLHQQLHPIKQRHHRKGQVLAAGDAVLPELQVFQNCESSRTARAGRIGSTPHRTSDRSGSRPPYGQHGERPRPNAWAPSAAGPPR